MFRVSLPVTALLVLWAIPAFANQWVATTLGPGAGGVLRVHVRLVSDFERTGCRPTPCYTMMWARLNVSPSVFGTTHYDFGSPEMAQAGIELPLWPGVEYSFSGYYAWIDFRPEQGGACAETDCEGNIAAAMTLFTPSLPNPARNSTWGGIKALFR